MRKRTAAVAGVATIITANAWALAIFHKPMFLIMGLTVGLAAAGAMLYAELSRHH